MVIEYMPENKNSHTHVNTKISLLSSNWDILLNENGCGQRVFSTSGSFPVQTEGFLEPGDCELVVLVDIDTS